MTDIDRLRASLRIGWVSLLAAGCDPGAPAQEAAKTEVAVTANRAVIDPIAAAEAAREAEALGKQAEVRAAEAARAVEEAERKAAAERAAAEAAAKAEAEEAARAKADPSKQAPSIEKRRPGCTSGDWSGPATLARKLASPSATLTAGCPRFLRHDAAKLSAAEQKALVDLPKGATGTLDVKKTQKAGAGTCAYDWVVGCPG